MSNDEFWRYLGMQMYIKIGSPKWCYENQCRVTEVNILSCEEIYYILQSKNDMMKNLRIFSSGLCYLYDMNKVILSF